MSDSDPKNRMGPQAGQMARPPRVYYGGQVAVKARNRPGNETGIVKNLSEGGAYLLSAQRYAPGTDLMVYLPLELGDRKSLCMVSGKVVRVEAGQAIGHIHGYGVRFDADVSKVSQRMLQDFVALKRTGKLPERKARLGRISSHRD
jgi:Tfp pilus assembly protein PilZ